MASKEELSEQLAITTKLNTVISQMASSLSRIEGTYEGQVAQIEKINTAIRSLDTERVVQEIGGLTDKIEGLVKSLGGIADEGGKSMQAVVEEASKAGNAATTLTGKMKEAASSVSGVGKAAPEVAGVRDIFKSSMDAAQQFIGSSKKLEKILGSKLPKAALITTAAVSGFAQGIKNVVAMTKSIGGFVTTFVSGLTSIAASIIAIPLKIFTGLVDMAANAQHGGTELMQAIEDLRKAFGDLRGPTNRTIIDLSQSFKGFHDTGLSTFRVFGMMHERLNMLRELVEELGGTFHLLEKELMDNGGAILAYQKGLGIANEEMGNIVLRAKGMGEETKDVLNSMTKQTLSLGKAFGISQKVIGKDMAKAMNNVAKFGGMAVKEIGKASVYARKLGLELEKITGALDYDNFEEAADAVSQLSQRFGVTVDTFKLLEEENPAKRIDMVKKALAAAGHDAATFNRHDLKLVASLAKVDEAAAKAAFSVNNQGVAMEDIQKVSEDAENQQLSQAEAMQKLADSIERLVKTGGGQTGGFWDMFVKGMMAGLQYSKEFRTIIWNIKRGLYQVFWEGMKLGRALPKLIKPLGELFEGLSTFFQPAKFKMLFAGIADALSILGAEGDAGKALDALKRNFQNFFSSEGDAFKKVVNGAQGLMKLISKIISSAIPVIVDNVSKGLSTIADLINDPSKLGIGGKAGEAQGFIAQILGPIFTAIIESWPQLSEAMGKLWDAAWPHIKKLLTKAMKVVGPFLVSVFFGPIVFRTLLAAGISMIGKAIKGIFTSALTESAGAKAGTNAAKVMSKGFGSGFGKFGKFLGPVGIAAVIADAAINIKDSLDKFEKDLAPKFGGAEAKMAAAGTGIINALTFGLLPDDIQQQLAESIAGLSKELFKAVEERFGPEFTKSLKEYLGSSIDVFGSLGQLIKDAFTGDEDKIAAAFEDLVEKLLEFLQKSFVWLIEATPQIISKVIEWTYKLLGIIFTTVGKILRKGKDIPLLGPVLDWVGRAFEKLGDLYKWIGKKMNGISEYFKMNGVLGTIKNFTKKGADFIKDMVDKIATFFKWVTLPIWYPFKVAWNIVSLTWEAVGPWFKEKFEALKEAVTNVGKKIGEAFSGAWEAVKGVFAPIKTWFTENVWKPIKSIFLGDGGEGGVWGTIKEAFTASFDAMRSIFSWQTVKEVFLNVVTAIKDALGKLADIPVFKDLIALAKKVFAISSPSKVFQQIGDDITAGLEKGMSEMPAVVGKKMRDAQRAAAREGKGLASTVSKASSGQQAQVAAKATSGEQAAKNIQGMTSQLGSMATNAKSLGISAQKFADEVRTGALVPALRAAQKMVETANELNQALADGDLNRLNIQVKLGNVAKAVGLGGRANYEIHNKGVNIKINMQVTMNAEDLEKAMVLRATSIIKNRIDFAGENPDDKYARLPDNPNSPVIPPVSMGKAGEG